MNTFAWILLLLPVLVGGYAYVVYPAVLWLLGRMAPPVARRAWETLPVVTIVIPAYNEEMQIAGAIDALLAQDYPRDHTQILILSDASTDRTDEIVSGYASHGVELLRMTKRSGKTAAENASCAVIRGEIVVNSDASIRLAPSAVRELVLKMADPHVGVASGRDVSISSDAPAVNATEAGYVGYEMAVRGLETRTGGIVGASGSGYAIRTHLHKIPIREDLSRDFSAALTACRHGYSAISVDSALCAVPRTSSLHREYKRKVRTISRGMETLYYNRGLLDPMNSGLFAWKLFSHKICRWLLPVTAAPALLGLSILALNQTWARVLLLGVLIGVSIAVAGVLWPRDKRMPRIISLAAFGVAANVAVLHAIWRMLHGHEDHIWEPTRRPVAIQTS